MLAIEEILEFYKPDLRNGPLELTVTYSEKTERSR